MKKMTIENTMAVMIDFQERLVPAIYSSDKIIENTVKFLKGMKALGCPVMFTQQYTKGLGMTVSQIQETQDEFKYFDKTSFSCFREKEISEYIEQAQKENIIIAGIESHICVMQTVLDLLDKGYHVYVLTDCIGSRKECNSQTGLTRMMQEGAKVTCVEAALFEIAQRAGTKEFKQVSKIIK